MHRYHYQRTRGTNKARYLKFYEIMVVLRLSEAGVKRTKNVIKIQAVEMEFQDLR
jgi:hypothetical protein